jgi:branched-chain amino acid transport system permease protein
MNLIQLLVDSLALGSQYSLVALGIGLIFGVMRMINFAQGDLITFGAYMLVVPTVADVAPPMIAALPTPLLIAATIAVVAVAALLTERLAFRSVRRKGADGPTLLITSFAIGYFIQSVILFLHTGRPKSVSVLPELSQQIVFAGVRVALVDLVTIIASLGLLLTVGLFLNRTRGGIALRAAAEDFLMARLIGVKADRVIAVAFLVSGALAGAVTLRMGVPLAIAGFVATVIGGMGSLTGAVLGGFALGLASTLLQSLLPPDLRPARDAFLYGLVILVLLVRPQGLFVFGPGRERV